MEATTRQIRGFAINTLPPVNGIPRLRFKLLKSKKKVARERFDVVDDMNEDDRDQMATSHSVEDALSDDEDDDDYEEGGIFEEENEQKDKEFEGEQGSETPQEQDENSQEDETPREQDEPLRDQDEKDQEELPMADDELQSEKNSQENDLLSDDDFIVDDEPEEKQEEAFKALREFQEKVNKHLRKKNDSKKRAAPPDVAIAKRKIDIDEYVLRGPLCSEITSPMITFTLLISQSDNNEWTVDRIEAHEPLDIISIAMIKKAIKRTSYFGNSSASVVTAALKPISANFGATDPITAMYMINSITNVKMKAVLRNVFAEPHYYESLNLLGPGTTITTDQYEVLCDPDSLRRAGIFERVAFSHKIQEKSMQQLISPSDEMLAIHQASLLYHRLEELELAFGHTALFEKMDDPWDYEMVKVLERKKNFVSIAETLTGKKYLRTANVTKMESETVGILKRFARVMIVRAETDDDSGEKSGYVTWMKKQKSEYRNDVTILATLSKRMRYLQTEAYLHAELLGSEKKMLTVKQLSLIKTQRAIIVDRAHVLSLPQIHTLMKVLSPFDLKNKELFLCGSAHVYPDGPGHPFADLYDYHTTGVERFDINDDINEKKIGAYYSSIEDALELQPPSPTYVFVANAALKRVFESKINVEFEIAIVPVTVLKNSIDAWPRVILVLAETMDQLHIAKAFQCAATKPESIQFVGDESALLIARFKKAKKRSTVFGSVYSKAD